MKFGRRIEPAGPKNRNWSSFTSVLKGCPSSSRQPGSSLSIPIGSTTAPERICAPTSAPFSRTTTESSGSTCFSRIAAARPAGPAPTITTSNSIASRSGSSIASVISSSPHRRSHPAVVISAFRHSRRIACAGQKAIRDTASTSACLRKAGRLCRASIAAKHVARQSIVRQPDDCFITFTFT